MPFDSSARRGTFLSRHQTLVLDDAQGSVLKVESGCLWITLERDPRDIILLPGMRFEIDRSGRTVVVAEEDSRVRVTRPPSPIERVVERAAAAGRRALRRWPRQWVPYY